MILKTKLIYEYLKLFLGYRFKERWFYIYYAKLVYSDTKIRPNIHNKDTSIVVDSFGRSAASFLTSCLDYYSNDDIIITGLLHSPHNINYASKSKKITVTIVRDPLQSSISNISSHQSISRLIGVDKFFAIAFIKLALKSWINFYTKINDNRVIFVRFEDVVSHPMEVTSMILAYLGEDLSLDNVDNIDFVINKQRRISNEIFGDSLYNLPSRERKILSNALIEVSKNDAGINQLLEKCNRIYDQILFQKLT